MLTWTWNSATGLIAAESTDLVGANGLDLADRSSQTPVGTPAWPLDGLHGAEADASEELLHFGARHMAMRDGLWLQPEPLLYLGPTNGDLRNPLGFGSLYAMGNTNLYMDLSGYIPITEKGLKDNPSPDTLEPSSDFVVGMESLEAGTAKRMQDPQDPAVLAGKMPENSQQVVIPSNDGEAELVGPVDTTCFSGASPPGGGNNGHGHAWSVIGPSTSSNPEFAGGPNDETTAIAVAATSSQGIGLVAVANGPRDGTTRTLGMVTAVRTSEGIVVSQYSGRVNQADNTVSLVRVGTPYTVPLPSAP
ncbi:MAG: hypothetical protein H6738_12190 [Alphaproteobacteria bacterium]|nr:hypothetical protein [Alphaproteobacteria bacterium]